MMIFPLIVDFGMVVLIWMVQLLIYPGFKYFKAENLIIWHRKYTKNMGYIVAPLMLVQLGFHVFSVISAFDLIRLFGLLLVFVFWTFTFLYFVPLHQKISSGSFLQSDLLNLEFINWWRTLVLSLIFLISLVSNTLSVYRF